jgi:hypothetical protein
METPDMNEEEKTKTQFSFRDKIFLVIASCAGKMFSFRNKRELVNNFKNEIFVGTMAEEKNAQNLPKKKNEIALIHRSQHSP